MALEPYKDHILVKPDPKQQESTTASGIVIQATFKRRDGSDVKLMGGEVIAIGKDVPIKFKEGLRVYFNPFDAYDLPDQEVMAMKAEHIYALET